MFTAKKDETREQKSHFPKTKIVIERFFFFSSSYFPFFPFSLCHILHFTFFTMPQFGTDENPIDTSYYELLGVAPNATSLQVKKAFR